MLELKDRIAIEITIDGRALPFHQTNVLESLHISGGTQLALPMVHIKYKDSQGWVSRNEILFDGALVQIIIGQPNHQAQTFDFVLNSYKEKQQGQIWLYEIDGYLAYPRYWIETSAKAKNGTASSVIAEITEECGWDDTDVDIEQTADDQIWLPANRRYHAWARSIADAAYGGTNSCMRLAVDPDKKFRLYDINRKREPVAQFGLGVQSSEAVLVTSYEPRSVSGLLNQRTGYRETRVEQTPLETSPLRYHQRIDVDAKGSLMMNNKVQSKVDRGRVSWAPIDPGNVNPNYERGLYQNRRAANLFSLALDILTPFQTNTRLLDVVTLLVPRVAKEVDFLRAYSSHFVVSNRAIAISGLSYFEKITLVTTSLNTQRTDVASGTDGELTSTTDYSGSGGAL